MITIGKVSINTDFQENEVMPLLHKQLYYVKLLLIIDSKYNAKFYQFSLIEPIKGINKSDCISFPRSSIYLYCFETNNS